MEQCESKFAGWGARNPPVRSRGGQWIKNQSQCWNQNINILGHLSYCNPFLVPRVLYSSEMTFLHQYLLLTFRPPLLMEVFLAANYKICLRALRKISQRTKLGQKWAKWPPLRAKIACFVREGAIIMADDDEEDDYDKWWWVGEWRYGWWWYSSKKQHFLIIVAFHAKGSKMKYKTQITDKWIST